MFLGHPNDDRIYLQPDSTTKPRPLSSSGSSGGGKKHKIKTDEIKPTSTFENLFGSPILNSKNSPDPKLSNNSSASIKMPNLSSGSKIPSQKPAKERPPEKSKEKREKKDKSGNTPKESSKETSSTSTSSKKTSSEDKHERREEKRKEKSSTKDRERSKDKSSKRPPSPKPTSRSPKHPVSPLRASSSNSNRHDIVKYDEKTSSSSGKKSKKEKRDKSKERERSTSDKLKESKHQMQQAKHKDDNKLSSKSMEKINGSSKKDENDLKERDKSNKYRHFDVKPPSPMDMPPVMKNATAMTEPVKKSHEKDERKHKHKKKDKNKDKDRKKSKSKDISDESPLSTSSNRKRSNAPTPTQQVANRIPNAKQTAMPNATTTTATTTTAATTITNTTIPHANQLSDKSSSEFDDDDYNMISPKPDKVSSSNDTNQSMDHIIERIPEIVTPRSNQTDSPRKHTDTKSTTSSGKKTKEPKSNQSSASKEEKKRKRKTKSEKQKHDDSGSSSKRKTQSPIINDEPPIKFFRKNDDKIPKIRDDAMHENNTNRLLPGRTPPVPHLIASPSTQQKLYHQSPDSSKHANLKRSADNVMLSNPSKLAHRSPTTSSSSSSPSSSEESPQRKPPPSSAPQKIETPPINEKQYMAQLKALQQKIMNLQDNDELQQVVEMIAATGCYEVTNRTFDFDLCALDRTTVQRLQERLG